MKKHIIPFLLTAAITVQLFPTAFPQAAENQTSIQTLTQQYENWKTRYVTRDNYVTNQEQYYVYYSEDHYDPSSNQSVAVTVSEAHGYGMLITSSMAAYDNDAKTIFDGMVRYYLAHPSSIGPHLMSWQQCDNGSALIDGAEEGGMTPGEADSATDGDLDIAYALLLADHTWGSEGEFHYREMAIDIIDDIMEYEVNHTTWTLNLGDWAYWETKGSPYYGATRCSDFILQYMPVFAQVTGDNRWMQLYESTNAIIDNMVDTYGTGLLPDFLVLDANDNFIPAPANFLEDVTDGEYAYNSCRIPWRIGMDYLINQNPTAKKLTDKLNAFILQKTGGDPENIVAGYTLDGTPTQDYNDLCFTAPFLLAAKCGDQDNWTQTLRNYILNYGDDVYFGDAIRMLCLIADAGIWQVPGTSDFPTETTTTPAETTETTESTTVSFRTESTMETTTTEAPQTTTVTSAETTETTASVEATTEMTESTTEATTDSIMETTNETTSTTPLSPETLLHGDVNLDGKVELTDAILLNKACASQVILTPEARANADCNNDTAIDTNDAVALLRFLVHLITQLPTAES